MTKDDAKLVLMDKDRKCDLTSHNWVATKSSHVEIESNFKQEMRRANLGNRKLSLHDTQEGRTEWEEKELFSGPIYTGRQIKNCLRQNPSKNKLCRVTFCDI